jgi:hypothetical protein
MSADSRFHQIPDFIRFQISSDSRFPQINLFMKPFCGRRRRRRTEEKEKIPDFIRFQISADYRFH